MAAEIEYPPSYLVYLASLEKAKQRQAKYHKVYDKEQYEKCKELGICTRCRKEPAEKDRVLCYQCRLWINQSRNGFVDHTRYRKRKKKDGGKNI